MEKAKNDRALCCRSGFNGFSLFYWKQCFA